MEASSTSAPTPVSAVDVLVDNSGRLGPLSYLVPDSMILSPGDAVSIPFGRSERHGLVLGPSSQPEKAVKEVSTRHGERIDPLDMGLAFELSTTHFASISQISVRLSPTTGRNSSPIDTGPVEIVAADADIKLPVPPRNWANRLYLRPPLASPSRIAALEALRLSSTGQVLILCPTIRLLESVLAEFTSGAARLDSKSRAGAWNGWRSGSVTIGVGTRAAALYSAHKLAGIVVVEEEHPGHIEVTLPYTNARDISRRRAKIHGCALTLISAAPSALGMAATKVLEFSRQSRFWPNIVVVDRSTLHPSLRQLPPLLSKVIKDTSLSVLAISESQPSRRICVRCGLARPCAQCPTGFCAHRELSACPRCAVFGVSWLGWDAARLKALVPVAQPCSISDMSALPSAARVMLFLNVDPLLTAASLNSLQQSASLLMRAAEAAGPGGTLLVNTTHAAHPLLAAMASRSMLPIAKLVWEGARTESLPPFGHLVTVRVGRVTAPNVTSWPGRVLGPRRRANEWEIMVLTSAEELILLRPHLERLRRPGKVRIAIQ